MRFMLPAPTGVPQVFYDPGLPLEALELCLGTSTHAENMEAETINVPGLPTSFNGLHHMFLRLRT